MRIIHYFSLLICLILSPGLHAQDTIKTREVIANYPGGAQEIYNVKLANDHIWHGKFRYTYEKVLVMEGAYLDDLMDGEWKYYYKSGKLKYDVIYSKGQFVRSLGAYFEDGSVLCSDSVSGKKEIVKIFSAHSQLFRESVYFNQLWMQTIYYYPELGKPRIIMKREQDTALTQITRYYKNGKVRSVLVKKGNLPWDIGGCFDPEGNVIDQGNLKEGTGTLKTYQDTDFVVLESVVQYTRQVKNGLALFYFPNGKVGRRGNYLQDMEAGKWIYFMKSGRPDFERNYDAPGNHFYEATEQLPADRTLAEGNINAEFVGGFDALQLYLKQNFKQPMISYSERNSRTMVLSFVVNVDGIAEDIEVVRNGEEKYEKEFTRMIKLMPRWMPGFVNGRPRKQLYYLPVTVHSSR